jgi:hypothetical protein
MAPMSDRVRKQLERMLREPSEGLALALGKVDRVEREEDLGEAEDAWWEVGQAISREGLEGQVRAAAERAGPEPRPCPHCAQPSASPPTPAAAEAAGVSPPWARPGAGASARS